MTDTLAEQIARVVVVARRSRKKLEEHGPRTSVCYRTQPAQTLLGQVKVPK